MHGVTGILLLAACAAWGELIQASQKDWFNKQSCSSCHTQILPAMAFRAAREHGIRFDEPAARAHMARAFADLAAIDRAIQYNAIVDPAISDGYLLVAADAAGVAPSLSTAIYARHIAVRQQPDGHWATQDERPHSRIAM